MNEKIYKTMGRVGGGNIAMGFSNSDNAKRGSNRCPDDRKRSRSAETTRGNYVLRKMPEYFGSACAEEVFRRF